MVRLALRCLAILAVSGAGCMAGARGAMNDALVAGRDEVALHHERTMAASTIDEIALEMDRHVAAMADVFSAMGDATGSCHCCGVSAMESMMQTMDDLEAAVPAHRSAVDAGGDLEAARAECDRYVGQAGGMLDQMDRAIGVMRCMGGM